MNDTCSVPFKDEVWPKFLDDNARNLLRIGDRRNQIQRLRKVGYID